MATIRKSTGYSCEEWITVAGKRMMVADMTDEHLDNAILRLENKIEELMEEYGEGFKPTRVQGTLDTLYAEQRTRQRRRSADA